MDFYRHAKASTDPKHNVAVFSDSTSTGTIRKHLSDYHLADWINACNRLKIAITGTTVLTKVAEYRRTQAGVLSSDADGLHIEFSKEAFIEAVVEWIIANDQVRKYYC